MVPKSKSTRNADYRHAQSIGRQRQAAQRAAADEIPDHLADVLPQDESPMLPDTEPVTASAAAPDPALQRAVVSACEYVQRMYDGAVDAARLTRAADIVLAGGVQHESPHHAMVTSAGTLYKVENGACPCADFTHRHVICQHALAVSLDRQVQTRLAPEPEPKPDAPDDDTTTPASEPLRGHWSEREPPLLYTGKFQDRELGIEHMVCFRADDFDELWAGVKEITRRVKAKREHPSDPPDAAIVPTPVDETPVCPYHGSMRPSSKVPGTFYCASKMGDGSYCRERWPKTK